MAIPTGTALGPYEILDKLGEGGMGAVYRARDTRLGRDVAVKVLPDSFAQDPERRGRFEREAQAVAALSHPNILAVFDTGLADIASSSDSADSKAAILYLVTELLEGETLRDRMDSHGALPTRKAIDIAAQIARGLSAAHAKNIVHRDLKPENVFLLADGQVKILDFGLARQASEVPADAAETQAALTDPGTVMGTVGYMAPEQVRGQTVDARADLFSLGAVLYEMVSGQRAFAGDSSADTMTAILREDPPELSGSRPDVSPALDRIIRHCLEKNAAERFQSARDVAFALEALSGTVTSSSSGVQPLPGTMPPETAPPHTQGPARGVLAAVGLGMLAAGALLGWWLQPATTGVKFDLKTFDRLRVFNARYMPDGETIVYSAATEGDVTSVYMLRADTAAPQDVAGPHVHLLSVSSQGELAVLTDAYSQSHRLFNGTLARLTPGGSPRDLLTDVREADWAPDGEEMAIIRDLGDGRDVLEYPVGTPLHEVTGYLSDVRVSHDGTRVAFVEHALRFDDRGTVMVVDEAGEATALTPELGAVQGLAWSADDAEVFYGGTDPDRDSTIHYEAFAVGIEGDAPPRRLFATMSSVVVYDTAADGRVLAARDDTRNEIVLKRPDETDERHLSWLDLSLPVQMSPDGEQLVFTDQNITAGDAYAAMIRGTDGSPPARLGEGSAQRFGLSPDGGWVVARRPGDRQLVAYPTGAGTPREIDSDDGALAFAAWFPDSQHVMLCAQPPATPVRCYRQDTATNDREPVGPDAAIQGTVMPGGGEAYVLPNGSAVFVRDGETTTVALGAPPGNFVSWSGSSEAFFSQRHDDGSATLILVNLETSESVPLTTISVADRVGFSRVAVVSAVGDRDRYGYVYTYSRQLSGIVEATIR